jgi:hypothetical protein
VLSSPKFNKRKLLVNDQQPSQMPSLHTPYIPTTPVQIHKDSNNNMHTYYQQMESPASNSKSWFQRWNFRSSDGSASNHDPIRDKEISFFVTDRPLSNIKANLTYAFLVVNSEFITSSRGC